jgi:hypothetical protein
MTSACFVVVLTIRIIEVSEVSIHNPSPQIPDVVRQTVTLDQTATNEVYTNTQHRMCFILRVMDVVLRLFLEALELLREQCSLSALVDATGRYNAPRCAESTRRSVLRRMEDWISNLDNDTIPASLFWLSGGAGAGKSALAQTLADKFQTNRKLAASFFFFKADLSRNNGDHLIPTLVYQLAKTFKGLTPFIEGKLHTNPDLFTKNRQTQAVDLLLEPLVRLSIQDFDRLKMLKDRPQLIVIDGLDECQDPYIQCDLLRIIAGIIRHLPYPFRFLITSRPESWVLKTFERDPDLQPIKVYRYNLSQDPGVDDDISEFLKQEFQAIRLHHPLRHSLPSTWPDQKAISMLVEGSSGHFIYASMVVKYLQSHQNDPRDRLDVVLELHRETNRPHSQLDELFKLILQGVDSVRLKEVLCAFGVIHLRSQRSGGLFEDYWSSDHVAIKDLFGVHSVLLFNPLLSVVAIQNETAEHVVIRIRHKSLLDFLLDFTRSGDLCINFDFVHEASANYVLKKIREEKCSKSLFDIFAKFSNCFIATHEFRSFAYHCQFAHLTGTLKSYLTGTCLVVPTQQHLSTNCSWEHPGKSLPLSIFYMFRTLSRKVIETRMAFV